MAEFMTPGHVMNTIYVLDFIIALGIIFVDKKNPTATLAWIVILFLLPVVGLAAYILFSQHIARLKIDKYSNVESRTRREVLDSQKKELDKHFLDCDIFEHENWESMVRLNLDYADAFITGNEEVDIIIDGKMKFYRLFEDIKNAKESINICYFIIKKDEYGRALIDLLTQKAKEGVEVRLLMDAMGSKQISTRMLKEFKAAGGKYAFYFKPIIRHLFIRFNYRNHRKIVVVDGKIAYIGGFNIAREYVGLKKKFGYWRDTHLRIVGNAVVVLNTRFLLDWRYACKEKVDIHSLLKFQTYVADSGDIPIQIVSSGPNSAREENKTAMMKMITNAKERIYIQTPYFVPDAAMMDALIMAVRSGVDVSIMIPCMPDHPFVYRTTLYNAGELIKEGAKVYIYENGFLHAKTLTVDGEVTTVGSTNFDIRSFKLNFETNAYVYDSEIAEEMEAIFNHDLKLCREYTKTDRNNISIGERILESISRLLTEIL